MYEKVFKHMILKQYKLESFDLFDHFLALYRYKNFYSGKLLKEWI